MRGKRGWVSTAAVDKQYRGMFRLRRQALRPEDLDGHIRVAIRKAFHYHVADVKPREVLQPDLAKHWAGRGAACGEVVHRRRWHGLHRHDHRAVVIVEEVVEAAHVYG